MIIELDTRESDKSFVKLFHTEATKKGYSVEDVALEFGDIKKGNIIIERKECNDFCASVCSNRLWDQLYKMRENKDYSSIIIISGYWGNLWKTNLKHIPQLEGAIKQTIAWGIPVVQVKDDASLTEYALNLFEYSKPIEVPIKSVKKNGPLSIVRAFPGIGEKKAKEICEKFGTPINFLSFLASSTEEQMCKELGKAKGKNIYKIIREEI